MDLSIFGEIRTLLTTATTAIGQVRDYFLGLGLVETDQIPLNTLVVAGTGAPLAEFVNGASDLPGLDLVDSEAIALRWNNHAAPLAVGFTWRLPANMDRTAPFTAKALCSKTGATVGDATTLTFTGFLQAVGSLHDADADMGGASGALDGDATAKTVAELSRAFAAEDLPADGVEASASITFKPTDGTLGTDDLLVHSLVVQYTRKAQA